MIMYLTILFQYGKENMDILMETLSLRRSFIKKPFEILRHLSKVYTVKKPSKSILYK